MYSRLANRVLLAVFVLFILVNLIKYYNRELWMVDMLRFMTEAALVGGIADWFAVTALFKKPLGFPWHTQIIPRQRERVIVAVADMIEKDLLSVRSIKNRVDKVNFVNELMDWVDKKNGRQVIKGMISRYLPAILNGVNLSESEAKVWTIICQHADEIKIAPYIKRAAVWLLQEERYEKTAEVMVAQGLELMKAASIKQEIYYYLMEMKGKRAKSFAEKVFFWLGEQTDSVNLEEAATVLYDRILLFVNNMKDPQHEVQCYIKNKLLQLVEEDGWNDQAELWKDELIKGIRETGVIKAVLSAVITNLCAFDSPVYGPIYERGQEYWRSFKKNQEGQMWLEERIKQALYRLIEQEHHLVGIMVKSVLNNFSDTDLNRFIEEKAGEDLQWIRINGCIVGSVAGMLLYLFLHFLYLPLLVQCQL